MSTDTDYLSKKYHKDIMDKVNKVMNKKISNEDFEHMFGTENGMDKMMKKYEQATGKKMGLTLSSLDEFNEWLKENEPDFYNSYKK